MPGLVRSIEIKYFRSIHRLKLKNLGLLNVLSGRNDVGKSTVLKALNLFFNAETDWGAPLDFSRDFSQRRRAEVQSSVKGRQFIAVAVEFETPGYEGSLPRAFIATKTWLKDGSVQFKDNLEALDRSGLVPATLPSARTQLGRLLGRIKYEYVPAVRDREYFRHSLQRLQSSLLGIRTGREGAIIAAADSLAEHIVDVIGDLQADFESATGIRSLIRPPRELGTLFQAFGVTTELASGSEVPLEYRGDGIQSRFVPSLLRFIADGTSEHFLWGFEEPENSLEHRHAILLANAFLSEYSRSAQIFVTSHSPAFTTLTGEGVRIFRVTREDGATGVSPAGSDIDYDLGYLDLFEDLFRHLKGRAQQREDLVNLLDRVGREAREAGVPLVIVEGGTDQALITLAWARLRPDVPMPFILTAADPEEGAGGGGAGAVRMALSSALPRLIGGAVGLFDRDHEGVTKGFDKLPSGFGSVENDVRFHPGRCAAALTLHVPVGREVHDSIGILAIEHMFADEVLASRTDGGFGLELRQVQPSVSFEGRPVAAQAPQLDFLMGVCKIADGKRVFAEEIAPHLSDEDFGEFVPLLERIEYAVQLVREAAEQPAP